jgi:hypothetical protein
VGIYGGRAGGEGMESGERKGKSGRKRKLKFYGGLFNFTKPINN